jgi:aspartate carbamoyltransferase regulatory subunit
MKEMKVDPIKDGTVIDHVQAGHALEVARVLNVDGSQPVMIGLNLSSTKHGRKDILKIESKELSESELNTVALISPLATYSIIKNYEIVRKSPVTMPQRVDGLIVCPNPHCVTSIENVATQFMIESNDPVTVRCAYCEKSYQVSEVRIRVPE